MVNSLGAFNLVFSTTVCALKKATVGMPISLRPFMRLRVTGGSTARWERIRGGNYGCGDESRSPWRSSHAVAVLVLRT